VVAIDDDGGVVLDAGLAQRRLQLLARGDVAVDGVDQVDMPVEIGGAGTVAAGLS
jgi:hypothetical protein